MQINKLLIRCGLVKVSLVRFSIHTHTYGIGIVQVRRRTRRVGVIH